MSSQLPRDVTWWADEAKRDRHGRIWKWLTRVSTLTRMQRFDTRVFVQAAYNFNPTGNDELDWAVRSAFRHRIRDNILAAGIDTAVSLIANARTAPQYLTSGGDWVTRRKAERRSHVLQGQMYSLKVFDLVSRAFRQACEGGTGYIVGYVGPDGRPCLSRPLHNEVFVDPEDGRYGEPRTIAVVTFMDRDELVAQSPASKEPLIRDADGPTTNDHLDLFIGRRTASQRVRVVDIWRLPTVDGGSDGRYVRCVSNATLVDRPYKRRRHRVVAVRFAERDQGYFGQSLTERMLPAQQRLSELDAFIARVQDLCSAPKWFIEEGSGVTEDDIANDVQVIRVRQGAQPPVMQVYSGTPPDLASQRREIKQDAYDQQGFGDNTVTGDVNKGLASGKAVRVADDVKIRRFISPARLLERAYLDVVRLIEDLNDEAAALDSDYSPAARYRSGRRTWLRTSKWSELALDDRDASVTLFPIAAQATTASDKYQQTKDWIDQGFVSKPMALDLQGFPDPEAFEQTETADLDLVNEQISAMLDGDADNPDMLLPVPWQDLDLAAYYVNKARLVAWRERATDDVLERLERYMGYVQELRQRASPPPAPTPAPASMDAGAAMAARFGGGGPGGPTPGGPGVTPPLPPTNVQPPPGAA